MPRNPQPSASDSDADVIASKSKPSQPRTPAKDAVTISDDEAQTAIDNAINEDGQDEEGDEQGEPAEGEYIVEEIRDHMFIDKVLYLKVKWKGYNKKSDDTWEPEENCVGAEDLVQNYYDRLGGKPRYVSPADLPPQPTKKRGRKREEDTPASIRKKKRAAASTSLHGEEDAPVDNWKPPTSSWEDEILAVDTVERNETGLVCYVQWNNGRKTVHDIATVYSKCPLKMLHFYEQHLVFKDTSTG